MAAKAAFDAQRAREVIDSMRSTPGAALPILNALQQIFGYIDDAAVTLMAEALNISRGRGAPASSAFITTSAPPLWEGGSWRTLPGGILSGHGM